MKEKTLLEKNKESVDLIFELLYGAKKGLTAEEKLKQMAEATPLKIFNDEK